MYYKMKRYVCGKISLSWYLELWVFDFFSYSLLTMDAPPLPIIHPEAKRISQDVSVKLQGSDNFLLWKTQAYPVLRSQNPLGFIDGSYPAPTSPADVTSWTRLDQMVLGWILVSLSDAVLSQVVDKKIAHDAWPLEVRYRSSSRARIQQLKIDLQTL